MNPKLAQAGQILVQVGGAGGVTLAVAGASGAAISAATVIAATAGGAAVVLVGWGVYKMLSRKGQQSAERTSVQQPRRGDQ